FVNRLEQEAIQVTGAHQLGEFVAIIQEKHLDQAVHGEEAADEEEILGLVPARDRVRATEDRAEKGDQNPQPQDLDRHFHEKITAERELARQGETPQAAEQAKVSRERLEEGHRFSLRRRYTA